MFGLGKAKEWGAKKLLEQQLKNAPPEQRQMIMTLFEKDPELLKKIGEEIQAETKKGSSQMQAAMKVMPKYQSQLQALVGNQAQRGMNGGAKGFNPNGSIRK